MKKADEKLLSLAQQIDQLNTEEEIRANLSEIKLFTSDINLVYGGNLVCS